MYPSRWTSDTSKPSWPSAGMKITSPRDSRPRGPLNLLTSQADQLGRPFCMHLGLGEDDRQALRPDAELDHGGIVGWQEDTFSDIRELGVTARGLGQVHDERVLAVVGTREIDAMVSPDRGARRPGQHPVCGEDLPDH